MQLLFNNMPSVFNNTQDWLAFDRSHLWHPYTSMTEPLPCYPVVKAKGAYLELANGQQLLDGMASWWYAIHGYQHPQLVSAAKNQLDQLSHVMFGGITHQPAVELGQRLVEITPKPLDYVFLADSGSISVEVAMKMALQYWLSQDMSQRQRFLTIRGGYHGDPFACMSLCDPDNGMHQLFGAMLPRQLFVSRPSVAFDQPWQDQAIEEFETSIRQHANAIAAVIVEPIVQGAGGMYFYHPKYLRRVRALCDELGVLLIFDEIATGFGRSGKLFALEHADVIPDILCLGKALTGGMMTLAATMTTQKVVERISRGRAPVLMHGPTFMGNPLACAVAVKSIDILLNSDWASSVARIQTQLQALHVLQTHPAVEQVRVLGAIGVVEMKQAVDLAQIQAEFVRRDVWIRPFGKLIYIMPPYILNDAQLATLCHAIIDTVQTLYSH